MAPRLTSPPILPARNEDSATLAPPRHQDGQTTMHVEAPPSQFTTRDRASSHRKITSNSGKSDPTELARENKVDTVKEKFKDVFDVSKNCNLVDRETLDNFSDEVSVAGRLSRRSSIEFFRSIGASEYLIGILERGHHPKLISEVPVIERKNNGSFFKHHDFAISEVRKLLASDRIEIVTEKPHCVLPLRCRKSSSMITSVR